MLVTSIFSFNSPLINLDQSKDLLFGRVKNIVVPMVGGRALGFQIITSRVCLIPATVLNYGTVHLVHTYGESNDLPVVCMKQNRVGLIKAVREFVSHAK